MSALLLRWRDPEPSLVLRWRGNEGVLDAITRQPETPLAAFVVPAALLNVSTGVGLDVIGNEIRFNIDELPLA